MSVTPQPARKRDPVCIGILGTDPLRSIGLQAILEEGLKLRTCLLPDRTRSRECRPSVVIVDESFDELPGTGTPLSHALARMPGVALIVLARGKNSTGAYRAFAAGARAVLPETAELPEIRACIQAVLRGKTWTPEGSAAESQTAPEAPQTPEEGSLTHRFTPKEREVMRWLSQGRSNREIAATMGIDQATVKAHLGRMLRKADATNRVELTLRALAEQPAGQGEGWRGVQLK